ncbi:hypothetical protein P7K49_013083 [Saguinus oedipus]|uniref:Uncharacterized protein n=1 Tax=Saguinus oedipus TaxID=9490 RepID=A0ABQ9VH12_SAGOE|nr:hypothetical protein P7K49_013083 [Saguinus oedipus]
MDSSNQSVEFLTNRGLIDDFSPVEVLQDLILEDIEDDEMPPDVRVSFLTAIGNQTSVVMDSSNQSVEFLTNRGLIDDFSPVEVLQDLILEDIEDDEMPPDVTSVVMDSSDQSVEFLTNRGLIDDVSPVEVLQDLILEDIEDDEMPPDVRNVFFWGLWDIKRVSFLTAIVNQTSVVMDSSDQSVEFLTNQGLIDDVSQKMEPNLQSGRPVEVLQDLIKEDIEDNEMPPDVRNVFFWGLWDIKRVSFLTAIVNQASVVMDSSDQSVEFLTNRGLIGDISQMMEPNLQSGRGHISR